jgi:hypothetical protein
MSLLFRRAPGVLLLAGLGASQAFAADRPATPEGVVNLQSLFSSMLPKPADGATPLVAVKMDGPAYVVSFDFGALNGMFKSSGADVAYDPIQIIYKLFEQSDSNWRLVMDSFPKLVARSNNVTSTFEVRNFNQTLLVDPAIAWWRSGSAGADGGASTTHGEDLDQSIEFGPLKADYATTVAANGAVSSTAKDTFSDIGFKISGKSKDDRPINLSGSFDSAGFNVGFDGLKTRKLFDAWTLVSANRDNLGPHANELKSLLRELATPGVKFAEGAEASKGLFNSPLGAITLGGFKIAAGVANAGPDSTVDLAVNAEGLSLPVGLAPPGAAVLTPSKIDVAATLKGVDFSAAAAAAIDRLRLDGAGPALTDDDLAKVTEALLSTGPLRVEIQPSHVAAPALDADLQGVISYTMGHATGSMTIRMRHFDMTMAAVRGMGPEIERRTLPGLAMAKGLAKTESDGSLSWVVEVDQNRSLTVNGIPLGKAPG